MSQAIPNAPQEFWQPPVVQQEATQPALPAACPRCNSEFMVGAGFCYVCGAARARKVPTPPPSWAQYLQYLKVLEFQNIKSWLGLPNAALVAFLIGVGCILGALAVGLIFSVQTLADFQAIQLWRIQWLLAALAAFVAGILLKRVEPEK